MFERDSLFVAGVPELVLREELLFNKARSGEAQKRVGAASLVVGTRSSAATEGLLANQSGSCLAVCPNVSKCCGEYR